MQVWLVLTKEETFTIKEAIKIGNNYKIINFH